MTLSEQLSNKPVITLADLLSCLDQEYSPKKRSREALIAYHLKQGHLLRIRRGLYAAVPPGSDPAVCPVDPYLVAANLARISHHFIFCRSFLEGSGVWGGAEVK